MAAIPEVSVRSWRSYEKIGDCEQSMCWSVQMDFPQVHNLRYLNCKHNVTTISEIIFHNQRHYIAIPTSLTY